MVMVVCFGHLTLLQLTLASLLLYCTSAFHEEIVSIRPLMIVIRDFATPSECHAAVGLVDRCHDQGWPHCNEVKSGLQAKENNLVGGKPWRNSTSFLLDVEGEFDPAIDDLVRRAHIAARHPITYGEGVQVASYRAGHYYEFHHDGLSRRATLLVYLTDVPDGDGGETIFPFVRSPHVPESVEPPFPPAATGRDRGSLGFKLEKVEEMAPYCNSSFYLKIRPEVGKAVLFYSYHPDYSIDEYAIHGACPMVRGHKAIFQRWMRFEENKLFEQIKDDTHRRSRPDWGKDRVLEPIRISTSSAPEPVASARRRRSTDVISDDIKQLRRSSFRSSERAQTEIRTTSTLSEHESLHPEM